MTAFETRRQRIPVPSPLNVTSASQETGIKLPQLDGEYTSVRTLEKQHVSQFQTKFGSVALHTMQVEVVRSYDDKRPRTSWYEALAAYRTDSDAPDQSKYPLVYYDNALLTTPRKPNTATNRYFLNPVYEGFAGINVSVKRKPLMGVGDLLRRAVPHAIPLEEMADDGLVIADHLAEEMGLGVESDSNGIRHINKSGYSRGVQLSLVEIARAGLHGMRVDRAQGRGPGPMNKVPIVKVGNSILKEGAEELKVIRSQITTDPQHAINNYLNVITHRPDEIISYIGDAGALLTGSVSRAMPYINPDLRGYLDIYERDPFGRHKDYVVNFEEYKELVAENMYRCSIAPNYFLFHQEGAHLSGLDKTNVKFDRLGWQAERQYLDGDSDMFMPSLDR